MNIILPNVCGDQRTRYTMSLRDGSSRNKTDICTRTINTTECYPQGQVPDYIRFDYTCTSWPWRRAHVLFLRALFREIGMPGYIIKQLTVPNLRSGRKGIRYNTRTTCGTLILLGHTLVRDMYEMPRHYLVAYTHWREGLSAVDAFNKAMETEVVLKRSGLSWSVKRMVASQAFPPDAKLAKGVAAPLKDAEGFKKNPGLRLPHYLHDFLPKFDKNPLRYTEINREGLVDVKKVEKYTHLFRGQ